MSTSIRRCAFALLGASALGAGSWASTRPSQATAPASSTSTAIASASASSEGFRPSEFAGVSVRERPASTSRASGRAWIAVKPGAKPPEAAPIRYGATVKSRGATARGGDKIVSPSLFHSSQARRSGKEAVAVECVPGVGEHTGHGHTER